MKLSNSQYDAIMRMYDAKQSSSRAELARRYEEIKERIPAYQILKEESARLGADAARSAILGDISRKEKLSEELEELDIKKRELLLFNGYPINYLDLAYECDKCNDTGFINGRKCSCFIQASIDLLYNQSNIKKILLLENFSNFNYDWYSESIIDDKIGKNSLENITEVVKDVKDFIKTFPNGRNFLFYGNAGVGKTFLTHCMAKELLDNGHSVIYLSAVDLFDLFAKYAFDNNSETDLSESLSQILDCELLIIDDLGTELDNTFTNSRLFYCINERINLGLSTVISTNLSLQIIRDKYSDRILSRISNSYTIHKIFGNDIRLQQKKN